MTHEEVERFVQGLSELLASNEKFECSIALKRENEAPTILTLDSTQITELSLGGADRPARLLVHFAVLVNSAVTRVGG